MNDRDLRAWGESRRMPDPSAAEARRLVERASSRSWRWVLWLLVPAVPGGMVLVAAAALLVVWWRWPSPPTEVPAPEVAVVVPGPDLLGSGAHTVGADEVVVDGEVAASHEPGRSVLALQRGTVTVHAAKRAPGEALVVVSEDWTVLVVGTRFTVVKEPFAVHVVEGVVAVQRGDDRWTLRAGDHFERGHLRPKATVVLPELSDLRRQLLGGDPDGARVGLGKRLAADPDDAAAWTLLAQLEARTGQRDPAVAAWREVVARGTAAEAQRARFEAAVLLEDRPADVVPLLTAFLASPDPLAAEARLRLGRAQLAVGDGAAARVTFEQVVADHPGTGPAEIAQQLLLTL